MSQPSYWDVDLSSFTGNDPFPQIYGIIQFIKIGNIYPFIWISISRVEFMLLFLNIVTVNASLGLTGYVVFITLLVWCFELHTTAYA